MRRWFVLLMVLMLPLRAVAGDVMSLGMALVDHTPSVSAGMSADCLMHMASGDQESETDEPAPPMPAAECNCCALCFPVAQAEMFAVAGVDVLGDAHHALGDDRFLSAIALGLLRPPKA